MVSLEKFENEAGKNQIQIDAVAVIQNGELLRMRQYSDVKYKNVYSIAKSYTATAIGMAIEEGLLSLDDKPYEMFSELFPDNADERWKKITLRHLLTMTSGHGRPYLMAEERKKLRGETKRKPDKKYMEEWLRFLFERPISYEPGERFVYSNLCPYVAGRMLEKAAGVSLLDYLYERLWKPLHMEKPRWDMDNSGHTFPASDLYLDVLDMAVLGQIYLGKGEYKGIRFISEAWVEEVTKNQIPSSSINPAGASEDEEKGYGYYFWINSQEGFRAYGKEGQMIVVLPKKNAVVAIQANHEDAQQVMDLMWKTIYPQL